MRTIFFTLLLFGSFLSAFSQNLSLLSECSEIIIHSNCPQKIKTATDVFGHITADFNDAALNSCPDRVRASAPGYVYEFKATSKEVWISLAHNKSQIISGAMTQTEIINFIKDYPDWISGGDYTFFPLLSPGTVSLVYVYKFSNQLRVMLAPQDFNWLSLTIGEYNRLVLRQQPC
jgi:hypothetical protein